MDRTYGIAELAREFAITPRTMRFYEDRGLLNPVREGQRRLYTTRDRVRLRLIMRGKRLGFSLVEIGEIIDLYDADPTQDAQLRLLLDKIGERRAALRQRQKDIAAMLRELDALEVQCIGFLQSKRSKGGGKRETGN